ncbi:MAG: hypothetical protein RID42_14280 [Alphaproteobacteria bacterium]|jgi:hypothetical protein
MAKAAKKKSKGAAKSPAKKSVKKAAKKAARKPAKKAAAKKVARKPAKKAARPAKAAKKATARKSTRRAGATSKASSTKWIPGHPYPEPKVKRIRTAKGRRPYFFDDPNIDKLLAMIMALTGEVSVIRERLDTHERLAQSKKWASHQAIEDYKPDDVTEAFRAQWRADYIARILRIVQVELDQITRGETEKDYDKIVEEVSK